VAVSSRGEFGIFGGADGEEWIATLPRERGAEAAAFVAMANALPALLAEARASRERERIVAKEEGPMPNTGILHVQLIGVKNVKTKEAFDKHGADLFIKENDKKDMGKEKIPEKIFEIERRILLKKKGYGA
jgi:hypothetical protein